MNVYATFLKVCAALVVGSVLLFMFADNERHEDLRKDIRALQTQVATR